MIRGTSLKAIIYKMRADFVAWGVSVCITGCGFHYVVTEKQEKLQFAVICPWKHDSPPYLVSIDKLKAAT